MISWPFIRRYLLPIICRSTVVKGNGLHLLVGFWFTLVIFAFFADRHRSSMTVTAARSKRWTRLQRKLTLISSRRCMTLIPQNFSGLKFFTRKYRSTTNPRVGNWQEPVVLVRVMNLSRLKDHTVADSLFVQYCCQML